MAYTSAARTALPPVYSPAPPRPRPPARPPLVRLDRGLTVPSAPAVHGSALVVRRRAAALGVTRSASYARARCSPRSGDASLLGSVCPCVGRRAPSSRRRSFAPGPQRRCGAAATAARQSAGRRRRPRPTRTARPAALFTARVGPTLAAWRGCRRSSAGRRLAAGFSPYAVHAVGLLPYGSQCGARAFTALATAPPPTFWAAECRGSVGAACAGRASSRSNLASLAFSTHPPSLCGGAWPPWNPCWPDGAHVEHMCSTGRFSRASPCGVPSLSLHSIGGSGTCVPMAYTGAARAVPPPVYSPAPPRPRPPARPPLVRLDHRSSGSTAV